MFACEQAGIAPDILCLGKGLSGGYLPLSVTMTTETIYQAFYDDDTARGFLHSHTHSGNALACRAALATLDIFEHDDIIMANRAKANYFNRLLLPLATHPRVKNFRNQGMIWAFEVETTDPAFSSSLFQAGLQEGLCLRPLGNTVYFMPPYTITPQEMDHLAVGTLRTLETC
jgi:adenosylmethionine-8-amino-7-oxononanoate aminotransferase